MKRITYILTVLLLAGCMDMNDSNPYDGDLHVLKISSVWPEGVQVRGEADVLVEDMNNGSRYSGRTDMGGNAEFNLPDGLYRVNLSGRADDMVFNASADKVVLSGGTRTLSLNISVSRTGSSSRKSIAGAARNSLKKETIRQTSMLSCITTILKHVILTGCVSEPFLHITQWVPILG